MYLLVNLAIAAIEAVILVEVTNQLAQGGGGLGGVHWVREALNGGDPLGLVPLIVLLSLLPPIFILSSLLLGRVVGNRVINFRVELLGRVFSSNQIIDDRVGLDVPTRLGEIYATSGHKVGDLTQANLRMKSASISILIFLCVALLSSPLVAGGVLVFLSLLAMLMRPLRGRTRGLAREWRAIDLQSGETIVDLARNLETISSFGVHSKVKNYVHPGVVKGSLIFGRLKASQRLAATVMRFAVFLVIIVLLAIFQNVSPGKGAEVAVIFALMLRCLQLVQEIVTMNQIIITEKSFEHEVEEWLNTFPRNIGTKAPRTSKVSLLSWSNLSAVGNDGEEIFSEVSGRASSGQLVVLTGESGSGKSTLLRMLSGYGLPSKGTVEIDGISIHSCESSALVGVRSYLGQRNKLLTGSVAENVDFFRGLPNQRIEDLLSAVQLLDELEASKRGLTTVVDGANHAGLSGGQLQRILVAQAVAGSPSLIFLDEPTSALDGEKSAEVFNLLDAEMRRGGIIVIATHDEYLVSRADLVVRLGAEKF